MCVTAKWTANYVIISPSWRWSHSPIFATGVGWRWVSSLFCLTRLIISLGSMSRFERLLWVHFRRTLLTPTRSSGHASATSLYRGPARIAEVLNDDELSVLTNYKPPLWAANPPQQNQREDRFLDSLEIDNGWDELIEILSTPYPFCLVRATKTRKHRTQRNNWRLDRGKDDNGLMRLYALLGEACDSHYKCLNAKDLVLLGSRWAKGTNMYRHMKHSFLQNWTQLLQKIFVL